MLNLTLTMPKQSLNEKENILRWDLNRSAKSRSMANTLLLLPLSSIRNYSITTHSLSKYESRLYDVTSSVP